MLLLTESDVCELLPMAEAIEQMEALFHRLAAGESMNQPRRRLGLPAGSALNYMAGADRAYFGIKIYSTHPTQGAHFLFLLYAAADAKPLAIFEANYLGQIRTGAASGYATKLLSRKDSSTVGVIGSGFQARTQIEAMCAVRQVRKVKVWSRSEEKRRTFAQECSTVLGVEVSAVGTPEEAVRGSDIVITATNARKPVLESSWIGPGTHVNAMGSNQANKRELPEELILRADLIAVDSLEQARMESGDLLMVLEPEQWRDRNICELKEVSGRPSAKAITIFKSNGIAAEDVASAGYVYEKAVREDRGRSVPILAG
jgi:ornithine cyclodeaminase/alanine dehydrogenase-like protein (mu-crystallin family)